MDTTNGRAYNSSTTYYITYLLLTYLLTYHIQAFSLQKLWNTLRAPHNRRVGSRETHKLSLKCLLSHSNVTLSMRTWPQPTCSFFPENLLPVRNFAAV